MRPTSPDPIVEPQAYQQHLLALLGDDDPAEVQLGARPAVAGAVARGRTPSERAAASPASGPSWAASATPSMPSS